jgi:exopolysaccharide biosynthesis WecB/TagA/CpsF family protein
MSDRRVAFLDMLFDPLMGDQVIADLRSRTPDMPFRYVVTPNVDHVVRLSRLDPAGPERKAYADAGWCLCDSRILSKLAALRGVRLPVVAGSDLTMRLLTDVLVSGDRLCLIGGDERAGAALEALRPDIKVLQHIPPMGLRLDVDGRSAAARFAAGSAARFTLIAVGSPQQELIALEMREMTSATGTVLCIGASIDFLTGKERRAPRWMQRAALEWLYRLLRDPLRLWRRYLVEGPRIFLLAWRWKNSP